MRGDITGLYLTRKKDGKFGLPVMLLQIFLVIQETKNILNTFSA